jgi:hypothetical protein
MRVCRACGHSNAETEQFCLNCGRFLEFTGEELATRSTPDVSRDPPAGRLSTPPPLRTGATAGSRADETEADVPTGELPVIGASGAAPFTPGATAAGPGPPSTSYPQVPDARRPGAGEGIRPSDVQERGPQRAREVIERDTLGPGESPCPRCGTGNTRDRTFCRHCGERLRIDATPAATPPPTRERTERRRLPLGLIRTSLVALLLAGAGVGGWLWWKSRDDAKPVASATTAPPSSVAATAAPAGGVPCPDGQQLAQADAANHEAMKDFAFDGNAPSGLVAVLQFTADPFVTTICRDGAGGYWYFNREAGNPAVGVLSRAQVSGSSLVAHYPGNDTITYRIARSGTEVLGDHEFVLTSLQCANPDQLPAGFLDPGQTAPPPCTASSVLAWALPS